MIGQQPSVHIVARVNRTRKIVEFRGVNPVASSPTPSPATGEYVVRVNRANGTKVDYTAAFLKDACGDPNDDETGSLDLVVPNDAVADTVEILEKGKVLASIAVGGDPPEPTNVRSAAPAAGQANVVANIAGNAPAMPNRPKVTWATAAPGAPTAAAATGGASPKAAAATLFTVQVSADDGQSWRTVGVGLVNPAVGIDPQLLAGKDTILIRVTATTGFKSKSTTQTIAVKDL